MLLWTARFQRAHEKSATEWRAPGNELITEGSPDVNILIKTAWGSDESTKACFAFLHANAFAEAGHQVRIFLLGEAVSLMKDTLIKAVTPVGWPPLSEIMHKTIEHEIPISV